MDAGDGWLIFALPPAEIAVHPTHAEHGPELYFMCDDVERTVTELEAAGARTLRPIRDQGYGLVTTMKIPGNVEIGLYKPRYASPLSLRKPARKAARLRKKS